MLEIGNGGLNDEEEKSHFALWAISKAPLIIGADLGSISPESLAILKNKDLIDINQDPKSPQALCSRGCNWWDWLLRGQYVTYTTTTGEGDLVALILNWKPWASLFDYSFTLGELGVKLLPGQKARVTNLWDKTVLDITNTKTKIKVGKLARHESIVVRVSVVQNNALTTDKYPDYEDDDFLY